MNWKYLAGKAASWALIGGSAIAFYEAQTHPSSALLGTIAMLLGGAVKDMLPSPQQAKVIEAQKKELDSLRPPPPPERNL